MVQREIVNLDRMQMRNRYRAKSLLRHECWYNLGGQPRKMQLAQPGLDAYLASAEK